MGSFITNSLGFGTSQANSAAGPNGVISQQQIVPQINTANAGVNSNIANQNAFAQALQTQMNGGGPNLANSLLANATGQNVSNQVALMAGQRGTGSNAGLIARQAAQQGANIQQNAVGQAAVNRQQQQLGTQANLGNVYGQIGSEQGQNLATLEGAQANQNSAIMGATNANNALNAGIQQSNNQMGFNILSGAGQAAAGTGSFASTPKPPAGAEGGELDQDGFNPPVDSSTLPSHLKDIHDIYHANDLQNYAKGGKVKALVSPGEKILEPQDVKRFAEGKGNPMELGKTVPGKPKVPGPVNSYANDTVPADLKVNSIVVPRAETQSKDPHKDSAKFVQAVIEEQGKKKKGAK